MAMINKISAKLERGASLLVLTFIAAFAASTAQALPGPEDVAFDKGALFTVAGYTGASTLSGFSVLVRIAENSPSGFSYDDLQSKSTGADIAFVGMDGGGLPFEIDTWDPTGTSLIWVRLPSMRNGTQFVMCWGGGTSGKTVCAESPFSNYVGVWHMSEASGTVADATGHGLLAEPAGSAAATASIAVAGFVGNGRQCSASESDGVYLSIADDNALDVGDSFAVSGWINMASAQNKDARLFSRKVRNQSDASGWEAIYKKSSSLFSVRGASADEIASYTSSPSFAGAGWKHLFIVYDGNTATIYEDGEQKASATAGTAPADNNNSLSIGSYSGGQSSYFIGSVDECRLLDAVPSADWAKAEYDSMTDVKFLTPGAAIPYAETDDPQAGVQVSDVGYTNATVTATVYSRGTGASSADVIVEFSAASDFASPLWTTNYTVLADDDVRVLSPPCLTFGTTYYARAVVENSEHATLTTPAVSFTTQTPGTPAVSAETGVIGFSSFSVVALPTDIGTGGEKVTLWLDVSAAGDFSDTLSFGGVETNAVPASIPLVATGLANGTAYAARTRAVNVWGLEAVSSVLLITTRTEPVEMAVPTAAFVGNGVETLAIAPVDIEMDATYSVSLAVDGTLVREWSGLSGLELLSVDWTGTTGSSHVAVFTVVSSLGGMNWTREYAMPFAVGSTVASIADVADLDSMILRVGDAIALPVLGPGQSLAYDTNAVVSVVGTVFTALEPGACRVRIFSTDAISGETSLSGSGVLIVAPAVSDVKGGLFVNRTATQGTVKWCNASSWQKISGAEGHDWPDGQDDIALVYLPLVDYTVTFDLENRDIVLGYLGAGSTHENKILYISNGGITFQTSNGSESWLRFSGRTGGNGELSFNAKTPITLANDLVLDGVGQNDMRATFNGTIHIGDHVLRTDRVPYYGGGDPYPRGQLQLIGDVSGSGLFLHEADTTMRANGRKSFTGMWDIRNGRHTGNYGGCGLFLGGCHFSSATELAIRGAWMSDKNVRHGASVQTGWGNSYQYTASTNYFVEVLPPKVTLDGGRLSLTTEGPLPAKQVTNYFATAVRDDWYETGEFRIAGGPMGHINSGFVSNFNDYYPNAHTVITNLVVEPGGSSSFSLATTKTFGTFPTATNEFVIVNAPTAAWDSGKGYEILPFFFVNAETTDRTIVVRETATGRVMKVTPDSTADSTGNIREFGANNRNDSMADGSEWEAVTVYPWSHAYFAQPNSTVRIHSGYLNVVSKPFAPPDHANSASSTVDFRNRTAYVYVNQQNSTADIGCRVAGTAGFVKSAGGTLQLHQPMDALTGGVWVGAGRLSLLDAATLGDNDVSIAAGATLRIAGVSPFGRDARLDLEDRDWISTNSRVELDNGAENRVRRLYVNGVSQKRGTYGATGSGAEFIDDNHFSGTGWVRVLKDDLAMPLVIRMK